MVIQKYIDETHSMGCEFSFANMLLWSNYYNADFIVLNDTLVFCMGEKNGNLNNLRFSFPIGNGDVKKTIQDIELYCKKIKIKTVFQGLTPKRQSFMQENFPDKYDYIENRDSYDYIYLVEDLIKLQGKKYHAKRNHLNRFKKENNFSYENISADNIDDCLQMFEKWHEINVKEDSSESKKAEIQVVKSMCNMFDELELKGGLIRVDGKVVAFTIGERLNEDTFVVHIEKAFAEINGAYTAINQQFCENAISDYKYVNREEDLGIEGLRKSKLSYYPNILLEKDIAVLK